MDMTQKTDVVLQTCLLLVLYLEKNVELSFNRFEKKQVDFLS